MKGRGSEITACGIGEDFCQAGAIRSHVFCPEHRSMLPCDLAVAIFREYRVGQWSGSGRPSSDWEDAVARARTYLRDLVDPPQRGLFSPNRLDLEAATEPFTLSAPESGKKRA
jgi:hypothetical protein